MSEGGGGGVDIIAMDFSATPPRGLVTMVHDAATGRIYGYGAVEPPAPGTPAFRSHADAEAWLRGRGAAAAGPAAAAVQHTLAYLDVRTHAFVQVGRMGARFLIADANLQAIDVGARRHLSLMQRTPAPPPAWVNASGCDGGAGPGGGGGGGGCANGTLCCKDPEASGAGTGACYTVARCGAITDGTGQNFSDPFHLVAVDLDSAAVVSASSAGVCSIAANDCPKSIEVLQSAANRV